MSTELKEKLNVISSIFDIKKVLSINPNKEYIQKYYKINKIPYSLFHTKTDFIHMGISRNGIYKEEDLLESVRIIDTCIHKVKAQNVLELATGRGANSLWLAQKNSSVSFYGIDISKWQLDFAFKKAKKVANYHPSFGDYHNLKQYGDSFFDVVFVVEALCHSVEKNKVINEVRRVLKPEGLFIILDGYSGQRRMGLTDDEEVIAKLLERGMAVEEFEQYSTVKEKILEAGFKIDYEENLSELIIPTLVRFEKKAEKLFNHPRFGKIVSNIFPKEFMFNTISAYLFPILMKDRVFEYWITVSTKAKS